jgi:hypothetical protein
LNKRKHNWDEYSWRPSNGTKVHKKPHGAAADTEKVSTKMTAKTGRGEIIFQPLGIMKPDGYYFS